MNGRDLGRSLARVAASAVPDRAALLLLRAWALGVAQRPPDAALRTLLAAEATVYRRIDQTSIRYDDGVHVKHRLTGYHDFFVERISGEERVLDIGCGKGELAMDVIERTGATVVGLDNHRPYLEFARRRFVHPQLQFVEADALAFLPEESFDVVILSNVLEHIEDRIGFLQRVMQHVRPARVLLRVPAETRDWVVPLRRELGLAHFSDPTHYIEYTEDGFRDELSSAGLRTTEMRSIWGELWVVAVPA